MKYATDALSDHMNKLLELAELARYAGPEDRAWHRLLRLQPTSGYNARADAEEAMSRYKRIIGDTLRSHTRPAEAETRIAVNVLNGMHDLARPASVRAA